MLRSIPFGEYCLSRVSRGVTLAHPRAESLDGRRVRRLLEHSSSYGRNLAVSRRVGYFPSRPAAVAVSTLHTWQQLIRLPQEDMCQATGTPPHLKYEADGGPGVRAIMKLLATSTDPDGDRRKFFQAQVLFCMLRATDGHAKNFSLFLNAGGSYRLTPLYDVLSAYPVIGTRTNQLSPFKARMAMAVRSKNSHWVRRDILRRHWLAMGAEHGVVAPDGRGAEAVVDELVARTPGVVKTVRALLPAGFPMYVADAILDGLQQAADKLAA